MFKSHLIKNEVGRRMMAQGDGLIPILARFFRDRFPFFTLSPLSVERQKQATLYVDFDPEMRIVLSPRRFVEVHHLDNVPLIDDAERLAVYVTLNKQAGISQMSWPRTSG